MPRKKDPEKPPRPNLPVRFSRAAIDLFDALAADHQLTRSEVVRRLAARGLRGLKPGEKP